MPKSLRRPSAQGSGDSGVIEDVASFSERLNDLLKQGGKRRANSSPVQPVAPTPPAKPVRTFEHDVYMELKKKTVQKTMSANPALVVCRPVLPPGKKPAPKAPLERRPADAESKYAHLYAVVEKEKGVKSVALVGRPRYFQLSHDYEQTLPQRHTAPELNRSLSAESIYAKPSAKIQSSATFYDSGAVYYASESIVPPLKSENGQQTKRTPSIKAKSLIKSSTRKLRQVGRKVSETEILPKRKSGSMKSRDSGSEEEGSGNSSEECTANTEATIRAKRATLVRRKTQMVYDQQELAFKSRKAPQLFEMALLIRLIPRNRASPIQLMALNDDGASKFVPTVSVQFPPRRKESKNKIDPLLSSLPVLCYPDFMHAITYKASDPRPEDQEFVVTVTNEYGQRTFAYCCRYVASGRDSDAEALLPEVVCVLTPVQAQSFYLNLVREAVFYSKMTAGDMILKQFLQSVCWKHFPAQGAALVSNSVVLGRTVTLVNKDSPLTTQGAAQVIGRIGLDNSITIFSALLSEKRVLLAGESVPSVAQAVHMFASILFPFEWPHTLIPVVPDSCVHLCYSPTPYFIGILRANLDQLRELLVGTDDMDEQFMLVIDLDYGIIKDDDSSGDNIERCLPAKLLRNVRQGIRQALAAKETNVADQRVCQVFLLCLASLIGHYSAHVLPQQDGFMGFHKQNFVAAHSVKSFRFFLKWFVETGMFQVWIRRKMAAINEGQVEPDLFDQKLADLTSGRSSGDLVGHMLSKWTSMFKQSK